MKVEHTATYIVIHLPDRVDSVLQIPVQVASNPFRARDNGSIYIRRECIKEFDELIDALMTERAKL